MRNLKCWICALVCYMLARGTLEVTVVVTF